MLTLFKTQKDLLGKIFCYLDNSNFASVPVVCKAFLEQSQTITVLQSRYQSPSLSAEKSTLLLGQLALKINFTEIESIAQSLYFLREFFRLAPAMKRTIADASDIYEGLNEFLGTDLETPLSGIQEKAIEDVKMLMDAPLRDTAQLHYFEGVCAKAALEVEFLQNHYPIACPWLTFELEAIKPSLSKALNIHTKILEPMQAFFTSGNREMTLVDFMFEGDSLGIFNFMDEQMALGMSSTASRPMFTLNAVLEEARRGAPIQGATLKDIQLLLSLGYLDSFTDLSIK